MSGLFPNEGWPLYCDETGRVRDVRKRDLEDMVERWLSPETLRRCNPSQQFIVRSLAHDVDFLIRGGRFSDYSATGSGKQ